MQPTKHAWTDAELMALDTPGKSELLKRDMIIIPPVGLMYAEMMEMVGSYEKSGATFW